MYTTPQYRLWARMFASGIHDSVEVPPDAPESLMESLTGAAVAFAKSLSSDKAIAKESDTSSTCTTGVSPRGKVELRMKTMSSLSLNLKNKKIIY